MKLIENEIERRDAAMDRLLRAAAGLGLEEVDRAGRIEIRDKFVNDIESCGNFMDLKRLMLNNDSYVHAVNGAADLLEHAFRRKPEKPDRPAGGAGHLHTGMME